MAAYRHLLSRGDRFSGGLLSRHARRSHVLARGFTSFSASSWDGLWTDTELYKLKSFDRILIANRGEIACRVIKTCRKLGVKAVAVHSDADKNAMHVQMAHEAYNIGGPFAADSYLRSDRILDIAQRTGSQAIHPGYGFLSENAGFVDECASANLVFIGPPKAAIEAMGSKSASKDIMLAAGVPCVPGYHGDNQDPEFLRAEAQKVGYPLMIKAVLGGGGKGMRIVWKEEEFSEMLDACKRESMKSFRDERVLLERYIQKPRHIEFQVFADKHGNAVHLWERDCSLQRRHQKVLEEAPAPGMTAELRRSMGESAVAAARAVGYEGAGTVEFIFDSQTQEHFFMEMNTRLQVEHPVSELITRTDLVQWQLLVAAGHKLPLTQDQINERATGHALEARIYAENPDGGFLPATGQLRHLRTPQQQWNDAVGCRVDTGVREGDSVSVYYDPMIAKLIVAAKDRDTALDEMTKALQQYRIVGLPTNLAFLERACNHPEFRAGNVLTTFIDEHREALLPKQTASVEEENDAAAVSAFAWLEAKRASQASTADPAWSGLAGDAGFRVNLPAVRPVVTFQARSLDSTSTAEPEEFKIEVLARKEAAGGQVTYTLSLARSLKGETTQPPVQVELSGRVALPPAAERGASLAVEVSASLSAEAGAATHHSIQGKVVLHGPLGSSDRTELDLLVDGRTQGFQFSVKQPDFSGSGSGGGGSVLAPMSGTVVRVLVKEGDLVQPGQPLAVMEAMKMEHVLKADCSGVVEKVHCQPGQFIEGKKPVLTIGSSEK